MSLSSSFFRLPIKYPEQFSIKMCVMGLILQHFHGRIFPVCYARNTERSPVHDASSVSEQILPTCSPNAVCSRMESYTGTPRVQRLCRCPNKEKPDTKTPIALQMPTSLHGLLASKQKASLLIKARVDLCPTTMDELDGLTVVNDGQQLKLCPSTPALRECRYFHETTFTITSYPSRNITQQVMRCKCPKGSTTYISKWTQKHKSPDHKLTYHYACSPPTYLECHSEEPCGLFTVSGTSVQKQSICTCGSPLQQCPSGITEPAVKLFSKDEHSGAITYGAFCQTPEP